jgi:hypothetical protein
MDGEAMQGLLGHLNQRVAALPRSVGSWNRVRMPQHVELGDNLVGLQQL